MYFYALDKHSESVIGQVHETEDGIYVMAVIDGTFTQLQHGTLNPTFACTLTNVSPDPKGPGNGVQASCAFLDPSLGGGTGSALVHQRGRQRHRALIANPAESSDHVARS